MTTLLRRLLPTAAVAWLTLAACAPPPPQPIPDPAPAPTPLVGELPTATLPDGTVLTLELALTPEEISRGLMFRPSLPADRGMLFVFSETRQPEFWMKNTLIPLDIVFLDERGVVVHLEANAQPCAAEPCPRYVTQTPARAVLEVAAGATRQHSLIENGSIRVAGVPGYPLGPATQ